MIKPSIILMKNVIKIPLVYVEDIIIPWMKKVNIVSKLSRIDVLNSQIY